MPSMVVVLFSRILCQKTLRYLLNKRVLHTCLMLLHVQSMSRCCWRTLLSSSMFKTCCAKPFASCFTIFDVSFNWSSPWHDHKEHHWSLRLIRGQRQVSWKSLADTQKSSRCMEDLLLHLVLWRAAASSQCARLHHRQSLQRIWRWLEPTFQDIDVEAWVWEDLHSTDNACGLLLRILQNLHQRFFIVARISRKNGMSSATHSEQCVRCRLCFCWLSSSLSTSGKKLKNLTASAPCSWLWYFGRPNISSLQPAVWCLLCVSVFISRRRPAFGAKRFCSWETILRVGRRGCVFYQSIHLQPKPWVLPAEPLFGSSVWYWAMRRFKHHVGQGRAE